MDFFTAFTLDLWTVLIQSIIFGVVLAIAVRIALEVLTPANASTRFAVWFATLLVIAVFPVVALINSSSGNIAAHRVPKPPAVAPVARAVPAPIAALAAPPPVHVTPMAAPEPPAAPKVTPEYALQTRILLGRGETAVFIALYTFIAFLLLSRLAISYLRLRRLKRRGFPAPPEVRTRFDAWRAGCKTSRPVRLLLTDKARSPMAVGFGAPAVIIPEALLLRLTGEELDHLGLHELAHIRRNDDWTNLAQKIIQALCFFNPAVLWICRRLDFEREVACDDWVLTLTGHAKPYARSLTKVLEVTPWRRGPVLASGAVFRKQQIIRRIEMLLDGTRDSRPNISHVTLVVILMCIFGAFSQIVRMPALVAFGHDPGTNRSRWSSDGRTIETETRGDVEFADDDITVRAMSPGGFMRIKESRGWSRRELEIRDSSAEPQLRYVVDGRERPLDDQGRQWMGTILPMIIREHGIDAERRAERILQKRGAAGIFDEIDQISSGHVRRRYLESAISTHKLNEDELRRAMNRVARIDSDHEKANLLMEVADAYNAEQLRAAYFDAIDSINSDHEKRRVLTKLLAETQLQPALLAQAGRSIERIQSDHEKAQVLEQASSQMASVEPEVRRALLRAAASINSDHEKAKVLTSVLSAGALPTPLLEELLKVAAKIQSDDQKAHVLEIAAQQELNEARATFFAAARTINSDHSRSRVLSHVLDGGNAAGMTDELAKSAQGIGSDQEKAAVLSKLPADPVSQAVMDAVRSINSDHHKRQVLEAMLQRNQSVEVARVVVDLATTIGSEHDRAKVLEIIAERHGSDLAVRNSIHRALEKMGSDSEYRRIMSKLFAQPGSTEK